MTLSWIFQPTDTYSGQPTTAVPLHAPFTQKDGFVPGIQEKRITSFPWPYYLYFPGENSTLTHCVWSGPQSLDRAITKFDI